MNHETTKNNSLSTKRLLRIAKEKKAYLIVATGVVIALLVALVILNNRGNVTRHPNAAAFCKAYHASRGSDDLNEKVSYLRNLEQYAPNDIYPTVHKMRVTYEQAQKQPNNYFGLELGITGSINEFNDYTSSHCDQ